MEDWFDYTSVEQREKYEAERRKKLEEEFDAVFGDLYDELKINIKKL